MEQNFDCLHVPLLQAILWMCLKPPMLMDTDLHAFVHEANQNSVSMSGLKQKLEFLTQKWPQKPSQSIEFHNFLGGACPRPSRCIIIF